MFTAAIHTVPCEPENGPASNLDEAARSEPDAIQALGFEHLPGATLIVDQDGCLRALNLEASALLGDAAQRDAAARTPVLRALPWLVPPVERVLSGADEAGLETELMTPSGTRSVAARARRVIDAAGRPRGAVVALEDLTERRALEARQRSAERLAALGTLAAGLAHEVNNPLACVVAGLSFVASEHARVGGALAAELAEAGAALSEAREAAQRVSRIVRSLQSFGQSSAPFLAEVDLSEAVRKAVRAAEPEVRARARLVTDVSSIARVRATEPLLVELFLALLDNAAKAIPPGHPESHTVRVELEEVQGEAWVVISDTGSGLSGDARERAFDPFFTTRPGEGAGLGLSVGLGIVTALGGSLTLGGAPGRGTTATVRLPLAA